MKFLLHELNDVKQSSQVKIEPFQIIKINNLLMLYVANVLEKCIN